MGPRCWPTRSAARASCIEPPRPDVLPNEVAESLAVDPRGRLGRARDSRGGTLPARPRRQLLHLARDRGRGGRRRSASSGSTPTATSTRRTRRRVGSSTEWASPCSLGDGWQSFGTVEGLRPVPAEHALLVGARDIDPTEQERRRRLASAPGRRSDARDALDELSGPGRRGLRPRRSRRHRFLGRDAPTRSPSQVGSMARRARAGTDRDRRAASRSRGRL